MSFVLLSGLISKAETKVPCFIFSDNADRERSIDLAKLNRITFGENSMLISSSRDDVAEPVELLYALYHHIEIGDSNASDILTGIESVDVDVSSNICIDTQSKLLFLISDSDSSFSVGIFNLSGQLLLMSELRNGESMALETLAPGVYVAVATDERIKLDQKFIIN